MDEQVANRVSNVKVLKTHAVVFENQMDSLMKQVHTLTQEAVQQKAAVRNLRMQDLFLGLEEKRTADVWSFADVQEVTLERRSTQLCDGEALDVVQNTADSDV